MNLNKYNFLIFVFFVVWLQTINAQKPVISGVTVLSSGAVQINWFPVEGVTGYEIYRDSIKKNEQGFNPFDTVIGANQFQFIDTEVDARIQSVGYKIKCIPGEDLSDAHYTIYLNKISYDSCSLTTTLKWNNYASWAGGAYYNVVNNKGEILSEFITDTIVTFSKIKTDTAYTYLVRAISNSNGAFKSESNTNSVYTTPINQPKSENFYISNVTYDGSTVNFTTLIDTSANLLGHTLMVSSNNANFAQVQFDTLNKTTKTIEFSHVTENQPLFYKVSAIGVCHDTVLSTPVVQPNVLNVSHSNETEVALEWNKSFVESTETYNVNITLDGAAIAPQPVNSTTAKFNFEELDSNNTVEIFCFTVDATDEAMHKSLSNTVCVSREPKITMPNAFSPNGDGINEEFGPFSNYIKNVDLAEFKINIYDKYGGIVFTSTTPEAKWAGFPSWISQKRVSEGAYIYYLWFKTAQQKTYEKSGTINVVYP